MGHVTVHKFTLGGEDIIELFQNALLLMSRSLNCRTSVVTRPMFSSRYCCPVGGKPHSLPRCSHWTLSPPTPLESKEMKLSP